MSLIQDNVAAKPAAAAISAASKPSTATTITILPGARSNRSLTAAAWQLLFLLQDEDAIALMLPPPNRERGKRRRAGPSFPAADRSSSLSTGRLRKGLGVSKHPLSLASWPASSRPGKLPARRRLPPRSDLVGEQRRTQASSGKNRSCPSRAVRDSVEAPGRIGERRCGAAGFARRRCCGGRALRGNFSLLVTISSPR